MNDHNNVISRDRFIRAKSDINARIGINLKNQKWRQSFQSQKKNPWLIIKTEKAQLASGSIKLK